MQDAPAQTQFLIHRIREQLKSRHFLLPDWAEDIMMSEIMKTLTYLKDQNQWHESPTKIKPSSPPSLDGTRTPSTKP